MKGGANRREGGGSLARGRVRSAADLSTLVVQNAALGYSSSGLSKESAGLDSLPGFGSAWDPPTAAPAGAGGSIGIKTENPWDDDDRGNAWSPSGPAPTTAAPFKGKSAGGRRFAGPGAGGMPYSSRAGVDGHRRAASDSFANSTDESFLDAFDAASPIDFSSGAGGAGGGQGGAGATGQGGIGGSGAGGDNAIAYDKLDDEQLLSMFMDVDTLDILAPASARQEGVSTGVPPGMGGSLGMNAVQGSMPRGTVTGSIPGGVVTGAVPGSGLGSGSAGMQASLMGAKGLGSRKPTLTANRLSHQSLASLASGSDVSLSDDDDISNSFGLDGMPLMSGKGADTSLLDPKRAKRILANRQSAQRSRMRKLQYIAELEKRVSSLQMEVSTLTPQVGFLQSKRNNLDMENSELKGRLNQIAQETRYKDALNEALREELNRLKGSTMRQSNSITMHTNGMPSPMTMSMPGSPSGSQSSSGLPPLPQGSPTIPQGRPPLSPAVRSPTSSQQSPQRLLGSANTQATSAGVSVQGTRALS